MVWFSIVQLLAALPVLELWGAALQLWFCTAFPLSGRDDLASPGGKQDTQQALRLLVSPVR